MNIDDIQKLIELARANDIDEIEVETENVKVRVTGRHRPSKTHYVSAPAAPAPALGAPAPAASGGQLPAAPEPAPPALAAPAPAASAQASAGKDAEGCPPGCVEVSSPMVGTFYRAPAPDSPPFADVGQRVDENTTVCIIEAMKLMNEIKAEVSGVVRKALVENGEPVEFGQPLFYIEKA